MRKYVNFLIKNVKIKGTVKSPFNYYIEFKIVEKIPIPPKNKIEIKNTIAISRYIIKNDLA